MQPILSTNKSYIFTFCPLSHSPVRAASIFDAPTTGYGKQCMCESACKILLKRCTPLVWVTSRHFHTNSKGQPSLGPQLQHPGSTTTMSTGPNATGTTKQHCRNATTTVEVGHQHPQWTGSTKNAPNHPLQRAKNPMDNAYALVQNRCPVGRCTLGLTMVPGVILGT